MIESNNTGTAVNREHETDVLVVGSGAGALTAALKAAHLGAKVLVVEKQSFYGGTSATSGGGLWIPCNHLMPAAGIDDSAAEACAYLKELTGADVAEENVHSFVDNGVRMLRWLVENSHVQYMAMAGYADYYQELEGAKPGGRSIDPLPFDARELGDDFLTLQESHKQNRVLGLMGYSNLEGAVLLSKAPGWFKLVMKLAAQYFADIPWRFKSRRSRRLTMGNALIGALRKSLRDKDVPVWLESPVRELLRDGARVTGAVIERDGKRQRIKARKAVILGTGGFEHSDELRRKHLPQPTQANWSAANPGNTGDLLEAAQTIGAATALLDEAWWGPTLQVEGEDRARMLFTERSMPGCIMVNSSGRRFVNESVAYTTAVQAMYRDENLPTFAIFDSRYKREYPFGPLLPGGMRLNWLQPGIERRAGINKAGSLEQLAQQLQIDGQQFVATVEQFNGYAAAGVDAEFHRGENSYDLIYGDVRVQPNPCLAPLLESPFYGVEINPGDIGTKGGLLTNAQAQVVDSNGDAIEGLYAVGNCAASVTGRYYPGAGATLGPAMTFAFIAAEHACG